MIEPEGVTRIFRTSRGEVRALDGISLRIERGEFVVIRGPSGSGKTTLLLTLGGMLRPTQGRVLFAGKDLYALGERDRARLRSESIGFVFQMFHLVPYLTALENVLLAARPRLRPKAASGGRRSEDGSGGSQPEATPEKLQREAAGGGWRREAARDAGEILRSFGLAGRERHRPAQLSAGEKQRTALARALVHRPDVVLADEPTGNLDPENAAQVMEGLERFHGEGGTVVLVTHGTLADRHAGRIFELKGGRVEPA